MRQKRRSVNVENSGGRVENSEERGNTMEHERTAMRHRWWEGEKGKKRNAAEEGSRERGESLRTRREQREEEAHGGA